MNSWDDVFNQVIGKEYLNDLAEKIKKLYESQVVYPPYDKIFHCFKLTPYKKVKVVILGQDPYHGANQANGLAFSVSTSKIPPTLLSIFKELKSDLAIEIPKSGDLTKWAKNGVLLLNTTLTVVANQPLSHAKVGWEDFTVKIIQALNNIKRPICFILWGNHARSYKKYLTNQKHLVIESQHPSPILPNNNFIGSKPFSRVNDYLSKNNIKTIDWDLNN